MSETPDVPSNDVQQSVKVTPELAANPVKTDTPIPLADAPVPLMTTAEEETPPAPAMVTETGVPLVPPREEKTPAGADRIISGIDLLDYGAGGLLPNKVYVIKGRGGVGKSILGLQYLTRGLELQEPGILITDQKPENVMAQAHAIGFAIDESVKRGQLAILNPSRRYFDLVESPADVMAIVEELGDYIQRSGARRLVIDPVYTLINTSYSAHFALSITQSLINAIEDLPVTTLLVVGDEEDPDLNPIIRQLERNAFGVIDLSHDPSTNGRLMKLGKLRYADSTNLAAHYRILNGRGLINYNGEGETVVDVTKPWEQGDTAERTVLLLGASPETTRRVREALGSDYKVEVEANLHDGVERARREKPGLVLVTPSRALGAVSAILDLARNASSSVAFLSPTSNRRADKILYLRAGADDFLTEPFTPGELRARVDALIRRSGRRLSLRDSQFERVTPEEIEALMKAEPPRPKSTGSVIRLRDDDAVFAPDFNERLQRSIETVSKFDQPFALYWIKASNDDRDLNKSLAQLCRQEDIVCHNRDGEFVAILTGADQAGVKGFQARLTEKLNRKLDEKRLTQGYRLYGA